MKTAEEFFRNKIKEEIEREGNITLWKVPLNAEQAMRWAHEYANIRVESALETACEKVAYDYSDIDIIQTLIRESK